jgi:hypothetical protein
MSGHDNLPSGGTGEAQPLSIDDAMALDFYDPSEGNEEIENAEQSEVKPGEIEDDQEADDTSPEVDDLAEREDEGAEDEAANPEPEDDITVTVNGEKVALSDLKAGYMRRQTIHARRRKSLRSGAILKLCQPASRSP